IRLAKMATQRSTIAAPSNGYLGTSLLLRTLSNTFVDEASLHPSPPGCVKIELPVESSRNSSLRALERRLDSLSSDLAGFIVEPILGAHGIRPLQRGVLSLLRDFTKKVGALLICDEAQ